MSKRIKRICFIVSGYPTPSKPHYQPFVDQLIRTVRDMDIHCDIIYPIKDDQLNEGPIPPEIWSISTKKGYTIQIFSPRVKNLKFVRRINRNWIQEIALFERAGFEVIKKQFFNWFKRIETSRFEQAAFQVLNQLAQKPDALYGHFALPPGTVAARLGTMCRLPSFVAFGESRQKGTTDLQKPFVRKRLSEITGIIAVSAANQKIITTAIPALKGKIKVFPNGVDLDKFFPGDKTASRAKLGITPADFVIIFVGRFIEVKGVLQLVEASQGLAGVKLIYAGIGELEPVGDNIVFKGPVPHDQLPEMLAAADIFVLPTRNEGCSNATIEALACGLPVISSTEEFNDEILDDTCSLRVDPLDVNAIRSAIIQLRDHPDLRKQMGIAARKKAETLDIRIRAANIVSWMEEIAGK